MGRIHAKSTHRERSFGWEKNRHEKLTSVYFALSKIFWVENNLGVYLYFENSYIIASKD